MPSYALALFGLCALFAVTAVRMLEGGAPEDAAAPAAAAPVAAPTDPAPTARAELAPADAAAPVQHARQAAPPPPPGDEDLLIELDIPHEVPEHLRYH